VNKVTSNKNLDDIDFSVTIIGSGSPQYNPNRTQASALVQYKGIKFLVDMGNGTIEHLNELGLTGRNAPDALLLTHHHIDHNAEFIPMVHSKLMIPGNKFLVAGPSPIDEMVDYTKKFYKEDLNYRMKSRGRTFDENNSNEIVKVLKGGESFEYKGVKISTIEVPHSIKTLAYRFDVDGKSIVISGDLSYTNKLQKLAKNADILVMDGKIVSSQNRNKNQNSSNKKRNSRNSQRTSGNNSVKAHASIEEIAKMAKASNAKIMVLTHLGTQVIDEKATASKYSSLGFKGKVIVGADFLTITPDGNSFMLVKTNTSNTTNATQKRANRNSQSINNRNTYNSSSQKRDLMSRFDTNGDDRISEAEAKGSVKENFFRLDTNNDGFLSTKELRNMRNLRN